MHPPDKLVEHRVFDVLGVLGFNGHLSLARAGPWIRHRSSKGPSLQVSTRVCIRVGGQDTERIGGDLAGGRVCAGLRLLICIDLFYNMLGLRSKHSNACIR